MSWLGNQSFPYGNDLKINLNVTSVSHVGSTLTVSGQIAAVYPSSVTTNGAYYIYPVYVTPQGG